MKVSLQLKVGQQLTMTPQLQQAIRLLQLSSTDLQQEIQQAIDSNPLLERDEEEYDTPPTNDTADSAETGEQTVETALDETPQDRSPESIPGDLPVDASWEDTYPTGGTLSEPAEDSNFEERNTSRETLQKHLLWQINLLSLSSRDHVIATALVDSINPQGYLTQSTGEIRQDLETGGLVDLDHDEVVNVLHLIQHLEPTGVGARNLQECLLIQLDDLPETTPWRKEARRLVADFLQQLGKRDYPQIMRRCRLSEAGLKAALALIKTLNPRPGELIEPEQTDYITPDILVNQENGLWRVSLHPSLTPRLRVNAAYSRLIQRADKSETNQYLKDQAQEARWFIKSLQSRNETMLKVATSIVEQQTGFLEHGEEAMKPLVLSQIAAAVDMHESTISRVTTKKYMLTPRGIFELKYFFSSHVSTDSGEDCSATAIRALIRKIISEEAPNKPLSDSKIASLLAEKGIQIARRTVAKYREGLSIPPSNERKRMF